MADRAAHDPMGLSDDELMLEACRLAEDGARSGAGGPFGAVIADADGNIVGRGQNRVLQTGDPTTHAELEAIRDAVRTLERRGQSTLMLLDRPVGSEDPAPRRARMLHGHRIFASSAPCPMCLSAIYWARLDAVAFANDLAATREIGFDDSAQYEDFVEPLDRRRIPQTHFRADLGRAAYRAWLEKADRLPY